MVAGGCREHGVEPAVGGLGLEPVAVDPRREALERGGVEVDRACAALRACARRARVLEHGMCFETACSEIANGSASSPSVAEPRLSRATIARRTGSASAANARSERGIRVFINLSHLSTHSLINDSVCNGRTRQPWRQELAGSQPARASTGARSSRVSRIHGPRGSTMTPASPSSSRSAPAELRRRSAAPAWSPRPSARDLERVRVHLEVAARRRRCAPRRRRADRPSGDRRRRPRAARARAPRATRRRSPAVRSAARSVFTVEVRRPSRRASRAARAGSTARAGAEAWSRMSPAYGPASTCRMTLEHRLSHRRRVGVAVGADARLQRGAAAVGEQRSAGRRASPPRAAAPCPRRAASARRPSPGGRGAPAAAAARRRGCRCGDGARRAASASRDEHVVAQPGHRLGSAARRRAARRGCGRPRAAAAPDRTPGSPRRPSPRYDETEMSTDAAASASAAGTPASGARRGIGVTGVVRRSPSASELPASVPGCVCRRGARRTFLRREKRAIVSSANPSRSACAGRLSDRQRRGVRASRSARS